MLEASSNNVFLQSRLHLRPNGYPDCAVGINSAGWLSAGSERVCTSLKIQLDFDSASDGRINTCLETPSCF
jgi:hypothetical protein